MRAETAGGRHGPFYAGYRPHLVAEGDTTLLGIIITEPHEENMIYPGQEGDVEFELVYHPEVDYSRLLPGTHFTIQEGPKTVGEGQIK